MAEAKGAAKQKAFDIVLIIGFIAVWIFFVLPWVIDWKLSYQRGGFYMFPLTLCSVIVWAILMERSRTLRAAAEVDVARLRSDVSSALKEGRIDDAALTCEISSGPVATILLAGIRKYQLLLGYQRTPAEVTDEVIKAMEDQGVHVVSDLERYIPVLAAIGNIAPLFGFLGTVSGMIKAFAAIASQGMQPEILANNIAEALITTETGLMIGIPAYVGFNYFTARVQRFVLDIEASASEFMEVLGIEMSTPKSEAPALPETASE